MKKHRHSLTNLTKHKKKILYVVTEDWYFLSHRLPIAERAYEAGYEVHVACRIHKAKDVITEKGFFCHALTWSREDQRMRTLYKNRQELKKLVEEIKPHIIHYVAIKPILIGSLFAKSFNHIAKIYAFTGLGTLFMSDSFKHKAMRFIVNHLLRAGLKAKNSYYLFQNRDDKRLLESLKIIPQDKSHIIRGAGIDTEYFKDLPLPKIEEAGLKFAYVGRMLKDKGVGDLIKAHQSLWEQGCKSQLWLVGTPDPGNPSSYSYDEMRAWAKLPGILCLGHKEDIREIWEHCHVAVLMSKREGLPKSLLEAASCGRPLIASDVPGCREIVHSNENGYLVPYGSASSLAEIMQELITSQGKGLAKMGKKSREIIVKGLSADLVADKTLQLYDLAASGKRAA